jgi:hypothetical protein
MALLQSGFHTVRTHIPIEDSLTLEINSAFRALTTGDRVHGILHAPGVRMAGIALTPFAVLARLCLPRLSPSISAIAVKSPQ